MKKNNFLIKLKENLKKLYFSNKKIFFVSIFLIVAFVALCVFALSSSNSTSKKVQNQSPSISITDYSSKIEGKLVSMLSSLAEVNSINAFVMVDSTPTINYLTQTEETSSPSSNGNISTKKETVVFEKNGSVSSPIVVSTVAPKISGVLIVVNKISASTKLSIINSVSIVLNISPECISILQEQ